MKKIIRLRQRIVNFEDETKTGHRIGKYDNGRETQIRQNAEEEKIRFSDSTWILFWGAQDKG